MNITDVVQAQRDYFKSGKTKPIEFRIGQLKHLKKILQKNEETILNALAEDLGKPKYDGYIAEFVPLYEEINLFLKNIKKWAKTDTVSSPLPLKPSFGKLYKDPYGVVAVFAPWNYPVQLLLSPAIGSIAAGNCTVLKPADLTSKTQKILIELINSNFDTGFLHVIGGGIPECEIMLKEKFDFIFFTGSPRVGKIIMKAAAEHLTPVCLELGGKSPCIVDETADLEIAAKRITWAKFLNAGQTCVAPDYIYTHKNIKDKLIELVKKQIHEFYGKQPIDSPNIAKIINETHFERLKRYLNSDEIAHGGSSNFETRKIEPTLLKNVTWDSAVMQEEIFGPILPFLVWEDLNQVIAEINQHPKPLALYVFSKNKHCQEKVFTETSSGGGCINDCIVHLANSNLPFGGVGNSGMGRYHGKSSFETMSHAKGIQVTPTFFDNPLRYPTNSDKKLNFLRKYIT